MNNSAITLTLPSADKLAATVARLWLEEVDLARQEGVRHTVALSGGRITIKFFADVVAQSQQLGTTFDHVHFFWADERCVPPTDAESNFRMANELLFGPLKISESQIHRLKGEADPEIAAREASVELISVAPVNPDGRPILDLVLLGMGEDGHVASLFPGASPEVVNCTTPFLVIRNSPKPPPTRLSLSYAALAAARQIWTLASGTGKEKALHDSLAGLTPLGRVIAANPAAKIFIDIPLN